MSVKRLDAKLDQKKIAKQHTATYTTAPVPFLSDLPLVGFLAETESDLGVFVAMHEGIVAMKVPVILFVRSGIKVQPGLESVTIVRERDAHYAEMWRACDMAFCLSAEAVEDALDAMIVPLSPKKMPRLQNYAPKREKGNAFTFEKMNPWLMFAAMVRACETYRFPFDWKCTVRNRT